MKTRSQKRANLKRTRSGLAWGKDVERPEKRQRRNIDNFRFDTRAVFIDENGKSNNIKTSYQVHKENLEISEPKQLEALSPLLKKQAAKTKTYRPIEFSPGGTTTRTPFGKTLMYPKIKTGVMTYYSNIPGSPPASPMKFKSPSKVVDLDDEFKQSEVYKAIKESKKHNKQHSLKITQSLLEQTTAQRQANNGRRAISQNKVMARAGVSEKKSGATAYSHGFFKNKHSFENIRWEWLHLVAHAILGDESQHSDNLVAGTKHANTSMMMIEKNIPYLSEKYPQGFTLTVNAHLVSGVQIAEKIDYTIITPDFKLSLNFDTLSSNKPHIDFQKYMQELVKQLVEQCKINDKKLPSRR